MGDEESKHVGDAEEKHGEKHKGQEGGRVKCCSDAHNSGDCCCGDE